MSTSTPVLPQDVLPIYPWERQQEETEKAFRAFAVYRDLGLVRTLTKASTEIGTCRNQIAEWSAKYGWKDRTRAFDMHEDRISLLARRAAIESMNLRHAEAAEMAILVAAKEIKRYIKEGLELRPAELAKLLDVAVKIERLARGEPDSIQDNNSSTVQVQIYMPDNGRDKKRDDETGQT